MNWICRCDVEGFDNAVMGFGYSPQDAWEDMLEMHNLVPEDIEDGPVFFKETEVSRVTRFECTEENTEDFDD